jgi:UDP-N-acetylglucosamine transferase subunit ALG13
VIFVAVGTQFAFDRLIRAVDEWALEHDVDGFAQIASGAYLPRRLAWARYVPTPDFNARLRGATLIVSHAGMGNILTAQQARKPIVVMNRQHALGEHRNDHQREGLDWMGRLPGVYTATTSEELHQWLDRRESLQAPGSLPDENLCRLTDFIDTALRDAVRR